MIVKANRLLDRPSLRTGRPEPSTGLSAAPLPVDLRAPLKPRYLRGSTHSQAPSQLSARGDTSAEREGERLHASIEELDLELSIDDRLRLSDQLIQPLFDHRAVAAVVHVEAVSRTRRLPVNRHAETHWSSLAVADP